jgi:hypothetical protein
MHEVSYRTDDTSKTHRLAGGIGDGDHPPMDRSPELCSYSRDLRRSHIFDFYKPSRLLHTTSLDTHLYAKRSTYAAVYVAYRVQSLTLPQCTFRARAFSFTDHLTYQARTTCGYALPRFTRLSLSLAPWSYKNGNITPSVDLFSCSIALYSLPYKNLRFTFDRILVLQ